MHKRADPQAFALWTSLITSPCINAFAAVDTHHGLEQPDLVLSLPHPEVTQDPPEGLLVFLGEILMHFWGPYILSKTLKYCQLP